MIAPVSSVAQSVRQDRLPGREVKQSVERLKQEQGAESELYHSPFCPKWSLKGAAGLSA